MSTAVRVGNGSSAVTTMFLVTVAASAVPGIWVRVRSVLRTLSASCSVVYTISVFLGSIRACPDLTRNKDSDCRRVVKIAPTVFVMPEQKKGIVSCGISSVSPLATTMRTVTIVATSFRTVWTMAISDCSTFQKGPMYTLGSRMGSCVTWHVTSHCRCGFAVFAVFAVTLEDGADVAAPPADAAAPAAAVISVSVIFTFVPTAAALKSLMRTSWWRFPSTGTPLILTICTGDFSDVPTKN